MTIASLFIYNREKEEGQGMTFSIAAGGFKDEVLTSLAKFTTDDPIGAKLHALLTDAMNQAPDADSAGHRWAYEVVASGSGSQITATIQSGHWAGYDRTPAEP